MNNENNYNIINIDNISDNVDFIKNKYSEYQYYIAVVKADCYGFGMKEIIKTIDDKVNYYAVATMDEALTLHKYVKTPILCLGVIKNSFLAHCIDNNITITIPSFDYLTTIDASLLSKLTVHIKINTGMNRLGVRDSEEFDKVYNFLSKHHCNIEGIYTHIYDASSYSSTNKQIVNFENISRSVNYSNFKIVHLFASDATSLHEKVSYANGIRMGINMYGLGCLNLKYCFQVVSEIIQINFLNKGESLGYNGTFIASYDNTKIGVIPLGYASGITRDYKGCYVYINDRKYYIVGNVCMNMMFVLIDDFVNIGDKVYVIKDNNHIRDIAVHNKTITYEILCNISGKIPRKYIKNSQL